MSPVLLLMLKLVRIKTNAFSVLVDDDKMFIIKNTQFPLINDVDS